MSGTPAIYPAHWDFRVIVCADAAPAVRTALLALQAERNEPQKITEGESSKGGKYQTLVAPMVLQNREDMECCGGRISRIPGVKFVL